MAVADCRAVKHNIPACKHLNCLLHCIAVLAKYLLSTATQQISVVHPWSISNKGRTRQKKGKERERERAVSPKFGALVWKPNKLCNFKSVLLLAFSLFLSSMSLLHSCVSHPISPPFWFLAPHYHFFSLLSARVKWRT